MHHIHSARTLSAPFLILMFAVVAGAFAAGERDGQVRVPAIPTQPPPPAPSTQVEPRSPTNQNNVPPAPDPCAVPQWLPDESARVDDAVTRLLKLQKVDVAEYRKKAPTNCAQQLFKYRVSVLGRIVAAVEGK